MSEVRLIDANALKYKNLAEVNGRLTYVLTAEEINNVPTVETYSEEDMYIATSNGYDIGYDFAKKHYEFDTKDFKKFVESRIDMQDLYLPTHFFDLLDEYKKKGGVE